MTMFDAGGIPIKLTRVSYEHALPHGCWGIPFAGKLSRPDDFGHLTSSKPLPQGARKINGNEWLHERQLCR